MPHPKRIGEQMSDIFGFPTEEKQKEFCEQINKKFPELEWIKTHSPFESDLPWIVLTRQKENK